MYDFSCILTIFLLILVVTDCTDYAGLPDIVNELEKVIGDIGLSLLINNAGQMIHENASLSEVTPQHMRTEFEINTIAPVQITKVTNVLTVNDHVIHYIYL